MPQQSIIEQPPVLNIDGVLFSEAMPPRCRLERRIVWNLLLHMERAGWNVSGVCDGGDERIVVQSPKEAMESVFSVDDSHLYFAKVPYRRGHTVVIVLGNGVDCISDMSIGEEDGFTAAIDAFDAERFA